MIWLILGVLLWTAAHLFPSVARPARNQLAERIGPTYQGVFALTCGVMEPMMIWLSWAYYAVNDEEAEGEEDEADEDGELEIVGILASISATQLVLEDGTVIETNSDTDFEDQISVGDKIEADVIKSGGKLIATDVSRD